jgi:hypothetical protein
MRFGIVLNVKVEVNNINCEIPTSVSGLLNTILIKDLIIQTKDLL